jgi:hypothetical protein
MSRSPTDEASLAATPVEALRTRKQRAGRSRCVTRTKRETHLPGWAGRLRRPRNVITHDELWHDPWADGTRVYDLATPVANVPVTIRGQGSVSPARVRSCRYHDATVELEFGARWPAQRV